MDFFKRKKKVEAPKAEEPVVVVDRCSVCGEPQFDTPSGVCCKNGHGGADAAPPPPTEKKSKFFTLPSRVKMFEKAIAKKGEVSEEEKRVMEQTVLIPDPLPEYTGPLPKHKCSLDKRVVRIVFPSEEAMEIVGKQMKIAVSRKNVKYITDISLLINLCTQLNNEGKELALASSDINIDELTDQGDEELELEENADEEA